MSRFDVATDQRAIEVAKAMPVRVSPATMRVNPSSGMAVLEFPYPGFYELRCGGCGVVLTLHDSTTGLVSLNGWRPHGWTLVFDSHKRGMGYRPYNLAELQKQRRIRLSPEGQRLLYALFPVTAKNRWRRLDLPVLWSCYRCHRKSGLDRLPGAC